MLGASSSTAFSVNLGAINGRIGRELISSFSNVLTQTEQSATGPKSDARIHTDQESVHPASRAFRSKAQRELSIRLRRLEAGNMPLSRMSPILRLEGSRT